MAKILNFPNQENQIKSETTGSVDSIAGFRLASSVTQPTINPNALYAVNWNGLENVQSLILILASIGFVFSPQHAHFETIKHLLDLQNPIIPAEQEAKDFRNTKI